MDVVIYTRVSSTEQLNGYSIEAQTDLCRAWCIERDYTIVRVYVEPGRSASTDNRPVFQRMIRNLCLGEAEAVIVHKVDRFARNLLDLLQYKKQLQDHHVAIYSVVEEFLNGEAPENDLVLRIIGATAEYVARNIGLEAKKGQDAKARSGTWPGSNVPAGYIRIGHKREARTELDPDQASNIRQAFNDFATGQYTLNEWVTEAKRRGYTNSKNNPIAKSSWQYIFRNNFYTGNFVWKGKTYQGDHPALVDEETWQTVQSILEERSSGGAKNRHFWLLQGLLWSEYQAKPMSGSLVTGRNNQYAYYRALGRRGLDKHEHTIRADEAEAQVEALLATVRWDGETHLLVPDKWLLAIASVPNLKHCWPHLTSKQEQRNFLKLIFLKHGLHVNLAGRVKAVHLRPGFKEIA